jgi:hypothetical protein
MRTFSLTHTESEIEALRKCMNRGTPYGTETRKTQIAATIGLKSTLQSHGRPRKPLESNEFADVKRFVSHFLLAFPPRQSDFSFEISLFEIGSDARARAFQTIHKTGPCSFKR